MCGRFNVSDDPLVQGLLDDLGAGQGRARLGHYAVRKHEGRHFLDIVRKQIVQALDKMLLLEMAMKIPYGQRVAFPGSVPELKGYSLFDMSLYSNWSIWERLWLSNE